MSSHTIHSFCVVFFSLFYLEITYSSIFSDMAIRCVYFIVFLCHGNVETDQTACGVVCSVSALFCGYFCSKKVSQKIHT